MMRSNSSTFDTTLLSLIFIYIGIGIIILYSGTDQNIPTLMRQLSRLSCGIFLMFMASLINPRDLNEMGTVFFFLSIIILLAVYLFGSSGKGAQRWLDIGVIKFQPSEIVKLTLPLALASWLDFRTNTFTNHFISFSILAIPCLLILIQPDLGTAILIGSTGLIMILISGLPSYMIAMCIGFAITAIPYAWFNILHDYQKARIITFLNPGNDSMGAGYHIIQSKIAIGSGGFAGKGWLNGTQSHLFFLPEHATDFIFGIVGEEFGFIGTTFIILLILAITYRVLMIAHKIDKPYERYVCCGLITNFFLGSIINIGMVIGIFPVVGVPLPLISYGGTHAWILLISLGIIFSMIRSYISR